MLNKIRIALISVFIALAVAFSASSASAATRVYQSGAICNINWHMYILRGGTYRVDGHAANKGHWKDYGYSLSPSAFYGATPCPWWH